MVSGPAGVDSGIICLPRQPYTTGTRRGLVATHGYGGTPYNASIDPAAGVVPLTKKLVDHGQLIQIAGTLANNSWGNDASLTALGNIWTALKSTSAAGWRTKTDKVALLGESMGCYTAINWATRNPTLVAALVLLIPPLNMTWNYTNDTLSSGIRASMDAAYGTSYPTTQPPFAQRDPMLIGAGLQGIPTKAWHASDDPFTRDTSDFATFATASGATMRNMGAVGHSVAAADPNEILAFLSPYL